MKLQDLREETIGAYVRRLMKDLHIKTLGSGFYSTVFQHPTYSNISVKVTLSPDPRYILWMKEAEKHQHNPWFPKIVGIHKVHFHADDILPADIERDSEGLAALEGRHIVFMQKLRPATRSELKKTAQYIVHTLPAEHFLSKEEQLMLSAARRRFAQFKRIRSKLSMTRKHMFSQDQVETLQDFEIDFWYDVARNSSDKNLRELGAVLYRTGSNDLNPGNVMIRVGEDGSLHPVITDPVSS